MSLLRALIFDVDGTLADTERDGHRLAFNRAFAQALLDWDWSFVAVWGITHSDWRQREDKVLLKQLPTRLRLFY